MKKPNGRSSSPMKGTRLKAEWREFADRLAQHVPVLGPDQVLILSEPKAHRFVQIAMQGSWGLKLEAVTDNYLESDDRLSARDEQTMRALGWTPPTLPPFDASTVLDLGSDAEADAEAETDDDDGSPSWTMQWPAPVPHADAALLVVRTLATVFHVRHPSLLQYYAFATDGPTILLPGLGIPAEPPPMPLEGALSRSVDTQVEEACIAAADEDVRRDGEVYLLEVDGVPFRVTAEPDAGVVRILSRVMPVDEIGGNLFELMNRLNGTYLSYGYVFVRDGDVRWATELVDAPFTAPTLMNALQRAAEVVKGVLALKPTL
ncbi:MAG: hypothetical protein K2R93_03180 [Gemmatimonadaceae bacterium]|nr:hypothetical protein [Gemmatimonadaceae bacterium]